MTPDPPEPLDDLLAKASGGDAAALERLVRRYEPRLRLAARALLRPHLRHRLDSIDLVQSVHRALLPGLRGGRYTFDTEDRLIGLAVTVLRHKFQRAAKPRPVPPEPPPPATPEQHAEAEDLYRRMWATLDGTDQRLLELCRRELTAAEMAQELGTTAAIVRARLSRLRQRLREAGVHLD
ncbi:RNA polymerase sigma factor [Limnoglobus roseus]|uniref:Sigma-70 family RNA polymerase sigma factor n=1 Tax=Limnoglobus roseus TaxID=2598579 RepID=A0A5C1A8C8_9BACT|nr:hypothetical protein [Limnoglobus roseus]QEL15000.1 sigma-70 family RNA polymerase sigma factor [Limnoglobus roseus]